MTTAVIDLLKRAPLVQCVGADFEAQTITFELPRGMVVAAGHYGLIARNEARHAIALDERAAQTRLADDGFGQLVEVQP